VVSLVACSQPVQNWQHRFIIGTGHPPVMRTPSSPEQRLAGATETGFRKVRNVDALQSEVSLIHSKIKKLELSFRVLSLAVFSPFVSMFIIGWCSVWLVRHLFERCCARGNDAVLTRRCEIREFSRMNKAQITHPLKQGTLIIRETPVTCAIGIVFFLVYLVVYLATVGPGVVSLLDWIESKAAQDIETVFRTPPGAPPWCKDPQSAPAIINLALYGVLALAFSSWVVTAHDASTWEIRRRRAVLRNLIVTGCFEQVSVGRYQRLDPEPEIMQFESSSNEIIDCSKSRHTDGGAAAEAARQWQRRQRRKRWSTYCNYRRVVLSLRYLLFWSKVDDEDNAMLGGTDGLEKVFGLSFLRPSEGRVRWLPRENFNIANAYDLWRLLHDRSGAAMRISPFVQRIIIRVLAIGFSLVHAFMPGFVRCVWSIENQASPDNVTIPSNITFDGCNPRVFIDWPCGTTSNALAPTNPALSVVVGRFGLFRVCA
jgi:hypothetical protein